MEGLCVTLKTCYHWLMLKNIRLLKVKVEEEQVGFWSLMN